MISCQTLNSIDITTQDVLDELQMMSANKAAGPGGIPPGILKNCAGQLAHPLLILFKKSVSEEILPNDWKIAQIISSKREPGKSLKTIGQSASPARYVSSWNASSIST